MIYSIYSIIIILTFICFPGPGWAKTKTLSFAQWLEKYQAWDSYQRTLEQDQQDPQVILNRAQAFLQMNKPKAALNILNTSFATPHQEGNRLWLMGIAWRAVGDYTQSILNMSQALTYFELEKQKEMMNSQTDLKLLWENVWRQWFWENLADPSSALSQARHDIMGQALYQGLNGWTQALFWQQIKPLWEKSPQQVSNSSIEGGQVTDQDALLVAQTLAALVTEFNALALSRLKIISNSDVRNFWQLFVSKLYEIDLNMVEEISLATYPKSSFFWEIYGVALKDLKRKQWRLPVPDAPAWGRLHELLAQLPVRSALERIEQELSSTLLNDNTRQILQAYAFAFYVLNEDREKAKNIWPKIEKDNPPLILKLCAMIVFNQPPHSALGIEGLYPALCSLSAAAGYVPYPVYQAPFWVTSTDALPWPLDSELSYINWRNNFRDNPNQTDARHLAFLFPKSSAGQAALLFLAKQANEDKNAKLAWKYLQAISENHLSDSSRIDFLVAKAGLEMELGRESAALATYKILMEKAPEKLSAPKRMKLALLAQQQGRWKWAEKVLHQLWENRQSLDRDLQAEILFWLGEGKQYQGDTKSALDAYLRLGWMFPDENIWAVTALYRAGLIYEKQNKLETAKRLFTTVLKNSDRKSQKKAAKDRIKTIEVKLGALGTSQTQTMF